ncbi:MAG: hypothetical protein JRI46_02755 [Deltaproteobacteria bacterium]|nr:hypothetical protein [Deltaproteobacteria bacterium]
MNIYQRIVLALAAVALAINFWGDKLGCPDSLWGKAWWKKIICSLWSGNPITALSYSVGIIAIALAIFIALKNK